MCKICKPIRYVSLLLKHILIILLICRSHFPIHTRLRPIPSMENLIILILEVIAIKAVVNLCITILRLIYITFFHVGKFFKDYFERFFQSKDFFFESKDYFSKCIFMLTKDIVSLII